MRVTSFIELQTECFWMKNCHYVEKLSNIVHFFLLPSLLLNLSNTLQCLNAFVSDHSNIYLKLVYYIKLNRNPMSLVVLTTQY